MVFWRFLRQSFYLKGQDLKYYNIYNNILLIKGTSFTTTKIRRGFRAKPKARQALPEPKLEWELANWIAACMYSACFDLADYAEENKWGKTTLRTRGSDIDTAPLIDLGMVCYELNQFEEAYKYFNDAYNYSKERAFQDRPKNI